VARTADQKKEVMMTCRVPRTSATALGVAAFVSLSSLSAARADSSAEPAPTPSVTAQTPEPTTAAAPSLSEPAPTPGWAEAGPNGAIVAQHPTVRHYTRHYAQRNAHRYDRYGGNPVATAATGVAGGVADLGSIAAYPFYCFPNYGSCSVRVPYRY
jgi:glucose/arabinose dehydrogenase